MRKKTLSLLLMIFLVISSVQTVNASVVPVYAGVNNDNPSVSIPVVLEANNYSIYVNMEGWLNIVFSYSTFTLTKGSISYFTVSQQRSSSSYLINYTIEKRLTITETDTYIFNFTLDGSTGDYMDYEVLLAETEIIYQPKTSIVAEAPYGFAFIFIAVMGVTIIQLRKRRER